MAIIELTVRTEIGSSLRVETMLILINSIRLLKILSLLPEIHSLRIIYETLKNMKGPVLGVVLVQFNSMYLFATIGMLAF
jgi:hypothetical protein